MLKRTRSTIVAVLSGALLVLGAGVAPAVGVEAASAGADRALGTGGGAPAGSDDPESQEAADEISPMIVGGTRATSSRGMALVMVGDRPACSGSIVHNRWVLTAKHCVMYDKNGDGRDDTKHPPGALTVRVKSLNLASGGGVVQVSLTKVRTNHDVALLKLNRSANAEPVRLASAGPKLFTETYAFGWGETCLNCAMSPYLKRSTQRVSGASTDSWGGEAIRTNGVNGYVCFGDSGGPLFKLVDGKRYQVGLLSSGDRSCGGGANHYSSVPQSKAWIEDVIARF
ncbi:S1 family peptidase [Streptomyces sp. NPDC059452]|uniref:S1 family peptidase n=1 Tax=Streptomyces sp. NPDC059452 TaxID=3346835 RepID=UPI003679809F